MKMASKIPLAIGLIHWPIRDRQNETVATNITNLDVHDIARVAKVYGLEKYFIIHRSQEQLMFVARLLDHHLVGEGSRMNPLRSKALAIVQTVESVDEAVRKLGGNPVVIGTTARAVEGVEKVSFSDLKSFMDTGKTEGLNPKIGPVLAKADSVLLVFGTGFGLTEEFLKGCHLLLEPLKGAPPLDYRHLSVRSAVSICLDRLLGAW
jgi:hypothetical protein